MENIKQFEALAKLDLSDAEREEISGMADALLTGFDAFNAIGTDNTEPMYTVLNVQNVLREDVSVKMVSRDELLANAPMCYDGYFQVPRTIT